MKLSLSWVAAAMLVSPAVAQTKLDYSLQLQDVLESVERNYPPLLAALQEGDLAEADLLLAQSRFDTTLRLRYDVDAFGAYPNRRFESLVEQPFGPQGFSAFAGYRVTDGQFGAYDGRLQTKESGEWRSGLRFPLLRDRATDSRRTDLRKAEIGRAIARLSIDQQRLLIRQAATRRYWDWAAAGRRWRIASDILDIAVTRDRQLRDQVEAGALPQFEVADNERIVLQRRSVVVEAERALQQAGFELSLYYRDASGNPVTPGPERVPPSLPASQPSDAARLDQDIERALAKRPEIQRLAAQREQNRADAALARNQRLPGVDLVAGFAQDLGDRPPQPATKLATNELKASIVFELPFQRRAATGKLRSAEAKDRQFEQRERYARDQVRAEVLDAYSAVEAAHQRARLLREEVEATKRVEDAERARFELGDGTLFVLNLREQATADAQAREVAAQADYQRALAAYELAIASALQ